MNGIAVYLRNKWQRKLVGKMTNELNYILESKNVNVYYGELHALKDINLKFKKIV